MGTMQALDMHRVESRERRAEVEDVLSARLHSIA